MEAATKLSTARAARPAPRPAGEGQGRRLTAAFEALDRFPALIEPRDRLLDLMRQDHPQAGEVVSAVESDVALSVAVLRWANRAATGPAP